MSHQFGFVFSKALRPGGFLLWFCDWRVISTIQPAIEASGLRFVNLIVWDKIVAGFSGGIHPRHEIVLCFSRGKGNYQTNKAHNLIQHPRVPTRSKIHPTEKPIGLISELLAIVAPENGIVLDPFMGSGTTGVACLKTGRRFVGIERDEKHFNTAVRRLSECSPSASSPSS